MILNKKVDICHSWAQAAQVSSLQPEKAAPCCFYTGNCEVQNYCPGHEARSCSKGVLVVLNHMAQAGFRVPGFLRAAEGAPSVSTPKAQSVGPQSWDGNWKLKGIIQGAHSKLSYLSIGTL